MYRLGSIVVDFDIIYDSSDVMFKDMLVQAYTDLYLKTNLTYDGSSVAAQTGSCYNSIRILT